ncbi:tol-pal system protein YbgF [Limibacillus sp. MBR-115]|jgi:tol-pal system protein YbgF|uniref:tol-pal system protein YbgF n=1 Tax=Limibacillus sp. MBR-115 TaxID=3156465 RepID=UPI003396ECF7
MPELNAFSRMLQSNRAYLGALALLVLLALQPQAHAQDVQALQNQVDRLQRELTDLQRTVYQGGTATGSSAASELPAGSAARLEVRMGELEQSLRQLRGQIEEMSFRITQNQERLDKLSADVDYRLTVLEGGNPAGAAALGSASSEGTDAGSAASGASSATTDTGTGGTATALPQGSAPQPGVLGQVSENELARVQQNKPADATAGTSAAAGQQTASAPVKVTLPEGSVEAQYEFALSLLRQTRFDEAEVALGSFLEKHPDHILSSNAKYWLGETYYVRGDYQNAAVTFAEGFQEFPNSAKAPDNLLKLGMALGQLGDNENACATFAQLQQRFPTAPANIQQKVQLERQRFGCS